jgi:hypothetical protein
MSMTEIEAEVRSMSQADRLKLAEKLDFIIHENDPEYQAELSRRVQRMHRGEFVTAEELMAVHERLIAQGR